MNGNGIACGIVSICRERVTVAERKYGVVDAGEVDIHPLTCIFISDWLYKELCMPRAAGAES